MKEKISDVMAFFRDPRARTMIRHLHAHKSLSGNDLCEVMGIWYPDDVSGRHMTACSFHSVRAHVSACLGYFEARIGSDGKKLESQYWIEPLR